jgi:ABC-type multidrug transport system ATPase subunit
LDEPFAGIDPIAVLDIQSIVCQLKSMGIGIIITDHNVRETLGVCDRAYILNEGIMLEEGTPEKIAGSQKAREIYLGDGFSFLETARSNTRNKAERTQRRPSNEQPRIEMAIELKQTVKLSQQQLVITPQLQQAIRLLQLTRLELVDMLSQELKENPSWKKWMRQRVSRTNPSPRERRKRPPAMITSRRSKEEKERCQGV